MNRLWSGLRAMLRVLFTLLHHYYSLVFFLFVYVVFPDPCFQFWMHGHASG